MSKSARLYLRLILAFIKKLKLILLFGVVIGIVLFITLSYLIPHLDKQTEKIGVIGEYTTNTLPGFITKLISMGLTNIDDSGRPISGIAKSWDIEENGKTWTFHIDKNSKWQDGTQISSNDINYNFSDATVTKPDKSTIIFKLKTPLSNFGSVLSKPAFKQGLLGTGQWKVSNLTLAGSYIETLTLKNKKGDEKQFKFYPTEERAKLAYELGLVNSLNNLTDQKPFDTWKMAQMKKSVNKQQYVAVFMNTSDELLTDKDIRQALTYAIDKESFRETRALGPLSPNSWAYNPSVKPYDFDIKHAKELIAGSRISPDEKKNLKIKLTTVPDLLPIAEKIAKNWKEIGVNTSLQVASFVPDDYQALLATYDIPIDPDQYSMWHSTQAQTNITRYKKNPRIDKLLEDGRLETSETKRKAIYFDFQKYLLEDAPAAFLYYPSYYNVERK